MPDVIDRTRPWYTGYFHVTDSESEFPAAGMDVALARFHGLEEAEDVRVAEATTGDNEWVRASDLQVVDVGNGRWLLSRAGAPWLTLERPSRDFREHTVEAPRLYRWAVRTFHLRSKWPEPSIKVTLEELLK